MDLNDDDSNEEQEHLDHLIHSAAAITAATVAVAIALDVVERQPYRGEPLRGLIETERIIGVSDYTCRDQIRMKRSAFFNLCELVRERGLLGDSVHVSMEEKLCIFLNTIGHNQKNRQLVHNFGRSGHTISLYFNEALMAILKLYPILLKPPSTQTPQRIRDKPRQYYPYFKDCIGAVDGSHVPAWVPVSDHQRFRDRKGSISQNVLAACDFDMYFTYVLAGWEGSAADSRILEDALHRGGDSRFVVPPRKYYLVDAGFANQRGFLRPYRNVRYHLKEWRNCNQSPADKKELFNMRHSHLRNVIERAFGLLKARFKILKNQPEYTFKTQVKIASACILMHNYILRHGRMDDDDRFFSTEAANELRSTTARVRTQRVAAEDNEDEEIDSDEVDTFLDLDNDEEPGNTEVPTPQASYSTRRRGRPCGGSSSSQPNRKKTVVADQLIDPINRLADAINAVSEGKKETLFGERVNEAISEMYEQHEISKMSAAAIFLMKNKWAANAILSAPKERRVYMLNSMMHPSMDDP